MRNSWRASSRNGWQRSGSYGMLFHQSKTYNVRGRCLCAGPHCHHVLRTVPPRQCAGYACGHDFGMQRTMEALLVRFPGSSAQVEMAQHITTLPMRMGGLGLRSAMRTAPGAYWASWVDALHMLQQRLPQLTGHVVHHLSHPMHRVVSASCRSQHPSWTVTGSSLVPVGTCCGEASDLDPPRSWSQASGITAGSTARLPVPNTTFGRRWCLPSRVLQTRPICDHTPDHAPAFWRGCACPFPSPRRGACVGVLWIVVDNTVQRAHVLAFCVHSHPNDSCACVPRGWRHCEVEREIAGHEQ